MASKENNTKTKRKLNDSIDTVSIESKKPKKPMNIKSNSNTTESEDLAKALAWVYLHTAYSWIFNCDSGCFYDVCQKSVHIQGAWMVIYQPLKSMLEYDELYAAIIIKRCDKQPITPKMLKLAQPYTKKVDNLYLQSYNDILAITSNKWTHPVDGTLNKIMQIVEPFKLVDGSYKMKFEIRGAVDGCCGDSWYPAKLMAYLGKPTTYAPINEHGIVQDKEELEKFKYPATPAVINE